MILANMQEQFQQCIINGDGNSPEFIIGDSKRGAKQRFLVYHNAYRFRLKNILSQQYAKCHYLLGDEDFFALADAYLAAHPSNHFSVRYFGQHLASFLQNDPNYRAYPQLAELAAFEWEFAACIDAEDITPLSVDIISEIPPNNWPQISFTVQPAFKVLRYAWNVPSVWTAIEQDENVSPPTLLEQPLDWVIWRRDLKNYYHSLTVADAQFINGLISGNSFSDLCAGCCSYMDAQLIPQYAVSFLRHWFNEGCISGVNVP